MNRYSKKNFLIAAFGTVLIIALIYGANPSWFARTFLDIPELNRNIAHMLRAIMGLYIALGLFWLYAAFHAPYRNPALLTIAVFAGGLAGGRLVSLALDGPPAPLLSFYIVAELGLAVLAGWVFTRDE